MKNFAYFLSFLALLLGTTAVAQDSERLTFGVISDIHFDNGNMGGAMVKVPQALKNLTSRPSSMHWPSRATWPMPDGATSMR